MDAEIRIPQANRFRSAPLLLLCVCALVGLAGLLFAMVPSADDTNKFPLIVYGCVSVFIELLATGSFLANKKRLDEEFTLDADGLRYNKAGVTLWEVPWGDFGGFISGGGIVPTTGAPAPRRLRIVNGSGAVVGTAKIQVIDKKQHAIYFAAAVATLLKERTPLGGVGPPKKGPVLFANLSPKWKAAFWICITAYVVGLIGVAHTFLHPDVLRKEGVPQNFSAYVVLFAGGKECSIITYMMAFVCGRPRRRPPDHGPTLEELLIARWGMLNEKVLMPNRIYRYVDPDGIRAKLARLEAAMKYFWLFVPLIYLSFYFILGWLVSKERAEFVPSALFLLAISLAGLGAWIHLRRLSGHLDDSFVVRGGDLLVTHKGVTAAYPMESGVQRGFSCVTPGAMWLQFGNGKRQLRIDPRYLFEVESVDLAAPSPSRALTVSA